MQWCVLVLLWMWGGNLRVCSQEYYRIDQRQPGNQPPCFGLDLQVLTVSHTAKDLIFRVGVFNTTEQPVKHSRPLTTDEVSLTIFSKGQKKVAHPTTSTLTDLFPDGPLRARTAHTGLMTFPWGSDELDADALGAMELRVPGFDTTYVRLESSKLFVPVDWSRVSKRSPLNLEVAAQAEMLAIIPMRLHSLLVKDDGLEMAVSFKNMGRFAVTMNGTLGGQGAVLVTEHGEQLAPVVVSDSLSHRIAPSGRQWAPGEDNVGWIRFPLPHALAAGRLGFFMPGYGTTFLNFDPDLQTWVPALRAKDSTSQPGRVEVVLEEERTFEQLKRFWESASSHLDGQQWKSYFKLFRGDALHLQQIGIESWRRIPITKAEFKLSEYQRVKPDASGRLRGIRVDLRYSIASLPPENEFMTQMECDLQRNEGGLWQVTSIRYPELQPFWMLGYTEVLNSERFAVFFRPGEGNGEQAELAIRQLEKGYSKLLRTGLGLKPRYAAFSVTNKEDFRKMTGRDPSSFAGAASAGYVMRDNRLQVINEALYLNDYRFTTMQRAWGRHDREITVLHELVHLALADVTRPWTPAWLTEGSAMYFAGQCDSAARAALRQRLTPATTLVNLSRIAYLGAGSNDPQDIMTQYQFSGEAARWIVQKRGEAGLIALCSAFAEHIPDIWLKSQSRGANSQASARLLIARRTLVKIFPDLSIEGMDALVRQNIGE